MTLGYKTPKNRILIILLLALALTIIVSAPSNSNSPSNSPSPSNWYNPERGAADMNHGMEYMPGIEESNR